MRRRRKKNKQIDVDMSPLIDMVFILLIFFMVSTTFVKDAEVDIQRPSAASATTASAKSMRVGLSRTGEVSVDGVRVQLWMLQSRVRDFLAGGASRSVLVIADKRAVVEKLIEVVDQCRLAGALDVGVVAQQEAMGRETAQGAT